MLVDIKLVSAFHNSYKFVPISQFIVSTIDYNPRQKESRLITI